MFTFLTANIIVYRDSAVIKIRVREKFNEPTHTPGVMFNDGEKMGSSCKKFNIYRTCL
uniref:Uncharacterized protein n=1 Tax=Arion vulgaris TaxID=1028688 RepID=A0A0B6YA42_9EUPU